MASIAVIGSGAVGCYYGAMLARGGHDVRFLMRRDLEAVRERGLTIHSYKGDFALHPVSAFSHPNEIGTVDWVVCSLKATAIDQATSLVKPCVASGTRVLALMNGLGIEEQFARFVPPELVFGGMAFVGINRGEPGVVRHLAYGTVSIGHLEDDPGELDLLGDLLQSGGIEVIVTPGLRYARWEKLCWNVPFNGLSVAGGGIGTKAIMNTPALRQTAERAMREVVATANADLEALDKPARLDEETVVGRMFAQTEVIGDYATSMAIDYVSGREMEVEAILGATVRRADELGVPAPTIGALYATVLAADLRNRGEIAQISAL